MSEISWEHASEARAALQAIVADPEHGAAALSSPQTMSNLLKDLLPDAPREKSILVAAAEAGLADTLRDHVSQGANPDMAVRLTASSFAATTPYPPDACDWVTDEIAIALGMRRGGQAAGSPAAAAAGFGPAGQQWMPTQAAQGFGQDPGYPDPGFGGAGYPAGQPAQGNWPPAGQGYPQQAAPPTAAAQGYPQAQPHTFAPPQDYPQAFAPPQDYPQAQPQTFAPPQDFPQPQTYPQAQGFAPGYAQGPAGAMAPAGPGYGQVPAAGFPPPDPRFAPAMAGYRAPKNNSLAIAALICGVAQFLGWFVFLIPGFIAAGLALAFGLVSMKQMRQTGESGRGLAIAGSILGALGLVGGTLLIVFAVIGLHSQT